MGNSNPKKEKAEPSISEDDETGSVSPSRGSNSSKEKPPDFSNEPEPSDPKDLIQRLRAKQEERRRLRAEREELRRQREQEELCRQREQEELCRQREQEELRRQGEQEELRPLIVELKFLRFPCRMCPMSARNLPGFSTVSEPSDSEDLIQRQRAKQEELHQRHRLIAKLEKLLRRHRQRAKREVSWFLPMRSPWSARKPPGFSTEPEPSVSEDLIQRLRAKQEKLHRRRAGWEEQEVFRLHELSGLIHPSLGSDWSIDIPPDFSKEPEPSDRKDQSQRQKAKQEELHRRHRLIAKWEVSWFLPMTSPWSARKPPGFSTEPEPSVSEDLSQRRITEQEELRRLRAELEELRRQIAEEEVSWFLHMRSPWSARNPAGFITVSEPSDSEDLIQRLRAELEELRRQREQEELRRQREQEELRRQRELEELRRQREQEELRRQRPEPTKLILRPGWDLLVTRNLPRNPSGCRTINLRRSDPKTESRTGGASPTKSRTVVCMKTSILQ